ncbi:MAG TPA: hypothetical protein VLI90_15000 [Tepidisphaeraceae bacterium]|nr:hypothetical protein [Tepidisphaeraceae bacterium]
MSLREQGQIVCMGHTWNVRGNIRDVYCLVADPRSYTQWLRVVQQVDLVGPAPRVAVGHAMIMRVRSLLPYRLLWHVKLVRLEPGRVIDTECRVTLGSRVSLHGRVRFRFKQIGDRVIVTNDQQLQLQRRLPRWIAPLAQWIFRVNHAWAMSRARRHLQRRVRDSSVAGACVA